MKKFAVIENNIVLNIIVADSKAIAEEITGMTCIEYTNQPAEPGGTYENGTFIKRKPYSSWVLEDNEWKAPVDYPEQTTTNIDPVTDPENFELWLSTRPSYMWDEETISWIEIVE